ncbi:MAG: ECF RNA polymerase sigma factor SigK [Nakamurella sp.]
MTTNEPRSRSSLAAPALSAAPRPEASTAAPTGEELLVAVALGDQQAFAQLYDLMSSRVYGLVRRVLRDPAQAEEVGQEVMLEIWRRASRFDRSRGSALSWVMTMAHSRAVDRVRSEQSSTDRDLKYATQSVQREVDVVVDAVETSLERKQVQRCLSGLTPLQRESINLAYYSGYTQAEVSAALKVPLGTIKTRLRDGLIRLRDCLGVAS